MHRQNKVTAYSGKYIEHENKTYFLAPERTQLGCQGCSFIGKICNKELTDYCRQGYIFVEVKR